MAGKPKSDSLRTLATKFNTNYETVRKLKATGTDLQNEKAVVFKLSEFPGYEVPEQFAHLFHVAGSLPLAAGTATGLRAAIERLRNAELSAHNAYVAAQTNNPALAANTLKIWNTVLEQLRKVEESNPDIEQANSNAISREELARVVGTFLKHLRQDLDALPLKIATIGQNSKRDELQKIVAAEVERIIAALFAWKGLDE